MTSKNLNLKPVGTPSDDDYEIQNRFNDHVNDATAHLGATLDLDPTLAAGLNSTVPSSGVVKAYVGANGGGGGGVALGETSTTAYRGDRGKTAYDTALLAVPKGSLVFNVADYGAKNSTSIQAAIDAAEAAVVGSQNVPIVYCPWGDYSITAEIDKKAAHIVGAFSTNSVRWLWNAAAGGTMLTQSTTGAGGSSYSKIQGIEFCEGTAKPATFLDLSISLVDVFGFLNFLHFNGCSSDAIKCADWANLHWEHLRWDTVGGYCVSLVPTLTQNLSSLIIDKFTWDNYSGGVGAGGKGFISIDNTAGASNVGTVKIAHGRIELNSVQSSPKALFHVKLPNPAPDRSVAFALDGVDIAAADSNYLVYRETADTDGEEKLSMKNVMFSDPSAWTMFGGTLSGYQRNPAVKNVANLDIDMPTVVSSLEVLMKNLGDSYEITQRRSTEAYPRRQTENSGKEEWGSGAAAPDTNLYRGAANVLQTDDTFHAVAGLKVNNGPVVTDISTETINFIIDGGGSAITTGIKGDIQVDFACTINSWSLLADASGAIVVDIWKDTYANFPPADADSMCSGKEPTIAATNAAATDTTITDWTTDDIAAGDILRFNVDSCTTIKRVTLALKVTRT